MGGDEVSLALQVVCPESVNVRADNILAYISYLTRKITGTPNPSIPSQFQLNSSILSQTQMAFAKHGNTVIPFKNSQ